MAGDHVQGGAVVCLDPHAQGGSSHLGHGGGGVVNLDGAQSFGEVHDLLDATERQAGEDTDADAAAVRICQGGVPSASETIHEIGQGIGLTYFLDGQDVGGQLGDGVGQGLEFDLVGNL